MANVRRPRRSYALGTPIVPMFPLVVVAQRAPTANDSGELGQIWLDQSNDRAYILMDADGGAANWVASPAGGATTLASLTVNPGNVTITAGDLIFGVTTRITNAGNATFANLTATGTTTISGDLDLTSASLIDLTATGNQDPAILLRTNGGAAETIQITNSQGTAVDAIDLLASVGGVTIEGGLATADAINITTTNAAGGIDIDSGTNGTILDSTGAISLDAAAASNFTVTGAGIDLTLSSAAGRVIVNGEEAAANAITLLSAAGGLDVDTALQINIASSQNAADSIVITSSAGGIDITATGAAAGEDIDITATGSSVNITSTEADAAAIVLNASDAAGGMTISAGTAGINIGNDVGATLINVGNIAITADRTINVGTGLIVTDEADDVLNLGTGGLTADGDEQITRVINIGTGTTTAINNALATGDTTVNIATGDVTDDTVGAATLTVNMLTGTNTTAVQALNLGNVNAAINIDGLTLINDSVNANTQINTGTSTGTVTIGSAANAGAITIDTSAAFSIDGVASSNVTVTGAGADLQLDSAGGSVLVQSTENAALAIRLHANGGAAETIQIHANQGTSATSIDVLSDDGGITLTSTTFASDDAINLNAVAGGVDIDGAMQVSMRSSENTADSIVIESTAGGIDILASGAAAGEDIDITATGSSVNITSTEDIANSIVISSTLGGIDITAAGAAAGEDIDITATGSSVNITATEATADAIVLNASNAAGGIDLLTGGGEISISSAGAVSMVPGTATAASPLANVTINSRVGVATFTGFTTGAGANEDFTITCASLGVGDGIFCTVSNTGTNDADMTLEGVITQTAGTITIHTQNNGAAALNGNVIITFWIIN